MYKMYLISAEEYENARLHFLRVRKTGEIWASMKNAQDGMGVENMSDLVFKKNTRYLWTKNPTKEQIEKYKMAERGIIEKLDNLSEDNYIQKLIKTFMSDITLWQLLLKVAGVKKWKEK